MVDRGGDKDLHRRTDQLKPLTPAKQSNDPSHNVQAMWLFTKQELLDSPSNAEGISPQQETSYRRTMCGFMQDAGIKLKL